MTREDIVQANAGLIYRIMNEHFFGVDREDLFQEGAKGVMKAYKNYHKNGTTKFSTYAYMPIFGEMFKYVTQKPIKVSENYLRLYRSIETYRYSLAQKWGKIPTNEELAIELGTDVATIEEAILASTITISSLDKASDEDRSIYETVPMEEKISLDDKIAIEEGLAILDEDEQEIIKYRYFEDLTQSEIARKLNKTQVMVSRYEKRGLNKMRAFYAQN